jgi:zinc protease
MNRTRSVLVALALTAATASAQRAPVKLPPRPEIGPAKVFTLPRATMDSLPNGLRFAVIENHELPIVTVRVALAGAAPRGGFMFDPPGKAGTYGLMMNMLREGTKTRTSAQVLEEAAELGAELTWLNTLAFPAPWYRSPRSTWVPSLSLLADIYMNPALQPDAFTRVRTNLASFVDRATVGAQAAQNTMLTTLYVANNPSTRWATAASVRTVTVEEVAALHREYIRPQNTLVVIAGDVTPTAAREAMLIAFGGWQRGGTTITPIVPTPATPAPTTTIYLYDTPGAAQATIAAGQLVPGRDNPDATALETIATILGDAAHGRVYTEFRKERGLSYNPRVDLSTRPIPEMQPIYASGQVSPGVIDTAVLTYIRVLREMKATKPITQAELDDAKATQVRSLPRQLERLDATAGNILAELVDRLPPNYLTVWINRVNSLTLAQAQAATKYLDPDHMVIAVAADRSKVEQALRATGLPVVIVDK